MPEEAPSPLTAVEPPRRPCARRQPARRRVAARSRGLSAEPPLTAAPRSATKRRRIAGSALCRLVGWQCVVSPCGLAVRYVALWAGSALCCLVGWQRVLLPCGLLAKGFAARTGSAAVWRIWTKRKVRSSAEDVTRLKVARQPEGLCWADLCHGLSKPCHVPREMIRPNVLQCETCPLVAVTQRRSAAGDSLSCPNRLQHLNTAVRVVSKLVMPGHYAVTSSALPPAQQCPSLLHRAAAFKPRHGWTIAIFFLPRNSIFTLQSISRINFEDMLG